LIVVPAVQPVIAPGCAATLAPPLLSSRRRGWQGIGVDLHHFTDVDRTVPAKDHLIGIHLAGAVDLLQVRAGHTVVRRVRPGDITITPAGEPKRFQHGGDNVVIVVSLAPSALREHAVTARLPRPDLAEVHGEADPVLVNLGERVLGALGHDSSKSQGRVDSLRAELSAHLLRRYCVAPLPPLTLRAARLSPRHLAQVLEHIDDNLRDDVSLAGMSRAISMSPSHFAHAFRQTTGMPPHRFVMERRIARAKSLLHETDLPIIEIAHRIGCASHSHFSVLFRRATGRTPRDFRR
jgi:AraC family transcriptional regulator